MDQLARAIDGIASACRALGVPVVSGNVSLYNETVVHDSGSRSILPTPTIAAVGLVRASEDIVTLAFKRSGDRVFLLGEASCGGVRALGGSEWLVAAMAGLSGEAPSIDLLGEARLQQLLVSLARAHVLASAHDVADGGLGAALAECCAGGESPARRKGVGARVTLPGAPSALDALANFFGEAPSRVIVSASHEEADQVVRMARAAGVPIESIGETGGDTLTVSALPLTSFSVPVDRIRKAREACLDGIVSRI
jgi:phosphoribosylformylglycinamidine synthase